MGQSRRSRAKADDLGSKADDLLGQSRRSMGQSRRSRSKRTIWRAESRRSYGPKRTILFEIWTILFEVKRNHAILRDESRRSYGPKRTILSEVYETLQSWGMKADDPWIYFMKNQNDKVHPNPNSTLTLLIQKSFRERRLLSTDLFTIALKLPNFWTINGSKHRTMNRNKFRKTSPFGVRDRLTHEQ